MDTTSTDLKIYYENQPYGTMYLPFQSHQQISFVLGECIVKGAQPTVGQIVVFFN